MDLARTPTYALIRAVESDVAPDQEFGRGFGPTASQQAAHAGHQLGYRKRLDDIIVSAGREPLHALGFLTARRKHDDRQAARLVARPQPGADFDPGYAG